MISTTGYLTKAYAQPVSAGLRQPHPLESRDSARDGKTERIIEAEWQPLSPTSKAPVKTDCAAPVFMEDASSPLEARSPSVVTERYRQMAPSPNSSPGTLINIRA